MIRPLMRDYKPSFLKTQEELDEIQEDSTDMEEKLEALGVLKYEDSGTIINTLIERN